MPPGGESRAAPLGRLVERWRFSLLLALLVGAFFLQPLLSGNAAGEAAGVLIYAAILAAVTHLAQGVVGFARAGAGVVALWAVAALLSQATGAPGVGAATLAATVLLVGWVTACTLGLLLGEAKADGDALAGAVFGYFLIALLWSVLFLALESWAPGSVALPEGTEHPGTDMLYFSLVTLTTLGYGDILPVSPFAKILAGIEAAVGTLYLAVLIGRIVGALKAPRAARGRQGAGEAGRGR